MADLGKRYSRNLMGINASGAVTVTHAAALPATEGHTAFEQTTPAGVVTYEDGTNLEVANSYRLIQLQDGNIRASQAFLGSDIISINNVNAVAPVRQLDTITITDATITATLAVAGLKEFTLAARETTPGNQPFPVAEARVVVRDTTTTPETLLIDLVDSFNDVPDYTNSADEAFATALIKGTVTADATAVIAAGVFTAGSSTITGVTITGAAVTAGMRVSDGTYLYRVVKGSPIVAAAAGTLEIETKAISSVSTAAIPVGSVITATTGNIAIVGNTTDTHFSTIVGEDLESAAAIANTTAWKQGTGDYASVAAMEEEFLVYAGNTTINEAWEADYGRATRFASSATTYGMSFIKYKKGTASMAFANEQAHHVGYVILAENGGTAIGVAITG